MDFIDLTVDESSEDFGPPPFKFAVGTRCRSEDSDIIILNEHRTTTKVKYLGTRKRSASPIEIQEVHPSPKKQRLSPDSAQTNRVTDHEKNKMVLEVKDLFKPKGKRAIANMVLSDDVIERRFEPLGGMHAYPINLSLAELDVMVSRLFMSSVYGGSSQGTFPTIGQENLARHGMDDFMYLHMDFQPCAPQIPGRPGLWFNICSDREPFVGRVLTRDLKLPKWQYVGQYDVKPALTLTREEWLKQDDVVKNTWSKQICKKSWGGWLRASVQARKNLGREPTRRQVKKVFESGLYGNITPDDVMAALDSGKERLAVWTMVCIGYDHAFQQELCEKFPRWTPPPKEPKKPKATRSKKSKGDTKKGIKKESESPVKGKRKRVVESDSELDLKAKYDDSSDTKKGLKRKSKSPVKRKLVESDSELDSEEEYYDGFDTKKGVRKSPVKGKQKRLIESDSDLDSEAEYDEDGSDCISD